MINFVHLASTAGALSVRLCVIAAVVVLTATLMSPVSAAEKEFLFQRIKEETGKWVGVGNGPFKTMFPNGVPVADPKFTGVDLIDEMFKARKFGSIAADKGGAFTNNSETGKAIGDIHFTLLQAGDTFKASSTGGDDFDVATGTDAQNRPTLTVTAKPGKELKKGEALWMKLPPGAQAVEGSTPIYEGKLTPFEAPKPQKKAQGVPDTGNKGSFIVPKMKFDAATATFTFEPGPIDFAQYLNGTIVTANNPFESIIGSDIVMGAMQLIGPSADVLGAFELSDSGLVIEQGSTFFLGATLADVLLFADSSVAGFDTLLQATFTWEESFLSLGSRYLQENSDFTLGTAVFFRTNLLSATADLARSGESTGSIFIASTSTVPEPSTSTLLVLGLVGLAVIRWERQRTVRKRNGNWVIG